MVRRLSKDGRFAVQGKDYARKKGESTPLLAEWYNKKDISVGRYCPADRPGRCGRHGDSDPAWGACP